MRLHNLDAAKFVLVLLVVIGHLLEQVRHVSDVLKAAYYFLYLFHIPALALVSGAVASPVFDRAQARKWLGALLLPYILFQAIYLYTEAKWQGQAFSFRLTTPYWLLWYLFSLACWRVMLPVLLATRWPLAISCLVALLAGMVSDIAYPFSFSRTLVFLPFFVCGHLYGVRLSTGGSRWLAMAALLSVAVVAWYVKSLSPMWLYGSVGYQELKVAAGSGIALRGGLLMTGMVGAWALLRLMPVHNRWMVWLGQSSIGAYLLHGFVVRAGIHQGWFNPIGQWSTSSTLLLLALGGLVLTLAACALSHWLKPLFNFDWLWKLTR
ncbi:acyltransferase family protein [Luteimonas sp. RIT-PG2_3]